LAGAAPFGFFKQQVLNKMGKAFLSLSFIARAGIYNKTAMGYGKGRVLVQYADAIG
jgi:hypothetical protein